jgi:hypothetical protein
MALSESTVQRMAPPAKLMVSLEDAGASEQALAAPAGKLLWSAPILSRPS